MNRQLRIPISEADARSLKVGDSVLLSGIMVTGRDAAHKWLYDTFISKNREASGEDMEILDQLKTILSDGVIYHCGPVVSGLETKEYRFVSAGPTTSIREEPYQGEVMRFLNLRGVIGKGGMGAKTLKACREVPAVYFHAVGGAASLIAECVSRVIGVHKLAFGMPEAMWVIEVKDLPVIVTMDTHGASLHDEVRERSKEVLGRLIA